MRRALRNPIVDGKLDSWFGRLERAEERADRLRAAGASDVRVVTKDRGRYEVYATMPANMTTRGRTRVKERKPRAERTARSTAAPVSAVEPAYIEVAPAPKAPKAPKPKREKPQQFALSFEQPMLLADAPVAPAARKRPKMEKPPPRVSVVDELDETFTSDDEDDEDVMAGIKRRAAAKVEAKAAALAGRPEVDDSEVERAIDRIERAVISMQAAGRPNDTFTLAMSKAGALARKTSSPELRRAIADARKAAAALSGGGGARGFDSLDNPRGKRRRRRR